VTGRQHRKYLLDTHVWIWAILEPKRLDRAIRDVVEDGDVSLALSPISV